MDFALQCSVPGSAVCPSIRLQNVVYFCSLQFAVGKKHNIRNGVLPVFRVTCNSPGGTRIVSPAATGYSPLSVCVVPRPERTYIHSSKPPWRCRSRGDSPGCGTGISTRRNVTASDPVSAETISCDCLPGRLRSLTSPDRITRTITTLRTSIRKWFSLNSARPERERKAHCFVSAPFADQPTPRIRFTSATPC